MEAINKIKYLVMGALAFGAQKVWAGQISDGPLEIPSDPIEPIVPSLFNHFAGLIMMFLVVALPLFGLLWAVQKNERKIWRKCFLWSIVLFVVLLLVKVGLSFWLAYNS